MSNHIPTASMSTPAPGALATAQPAADTDREGLKHTAGPWRWELNENSKTIRLCGGVPKYDLTVMDFARYGMGRAAPRFREDVDGFNIMHRAEEFGAVVEGRAHHANWFKTINHPDAALIASAPDLLLERDRLKQDCANLREACQSGRNACVAALQHIEEFGIIESTRRGELASQEQLLLILQAAVTKTMAAIKGAETK